MGNVWIIVASCLAITDLCVGLIAQPPYASFLLSPDQFKFCYHVAVLSNTISDCNKCGKTSCTVVKIKIQGGGNFEESETPGGQLVVLLVVLVLQQYCCFTMISLYASCT